MSTSNQGNPDGLRKRIADYLKFKTSKSGSVAAQDIISISDIKQSVKLMESFKNAVIIIDADMAVQYESQSITKITGYTPEERQGISALELIHPEDLPFIKDCIDKFLNGELNKIEAGARLKCKDGSWRYVQGIAQIYLLESDIAGLIINLQDITGLKQTEKALSKSRERLDLAMKSTGLGIWDQNFKTGEIFRDELWTAMLGYKPGEIGSDAQAWKGLIHPDDLPLVEREAENHESGRKDIFHVEHRLRAKNGEWKWILNWGKIVERDPDGKPIRALGTHLDITKRKQTEKALSKTQERLDLAVRNTSLGIWDQDFKTGKIIRNELWAKMLGYKTAEIDSNSKAWQDLIHPDDLPIVHKSVEDIIAGRIDISVFEHRLKAKNGEWKWILNWGRIVERDPDGKPIRALGTHLDITDRKQAQKALLNSEAHLNLAQEVAHIGSWDWNLETNMHYWSDEIYPIYGLETHEHDATLEIIWDLIHPDDNDFVGKTVEAAREQGTPYNIEYRIILPNGKIRFLNGIGRPVRDKTGKVIRLYGTSQDITKRKQAEEALRESEVKHSIVIEHSNEMFYIHDAQRQVSYVSPQCLQIFGYSPEEMKVKWTSLLTDHPMNQQCFELTDKALKTGKKQKIYSIEVKRKDGEKILIEVDESPLNDGNGKIIGLTGAVRDVTERKQAEEALRESEEKYRNIVEMAPDGIATISLAGFMTSCNTALLELTGFSHDDLVDKHFSKLPALRSKDIPKYLKVLESMLMGKIPKPFEFKWIHKSGEFRLGEARLSLMRNKGEISGFQLIATDITERKQAEEALRESEERYRAIWENSPTGICLTDRDGVYHYVNPAYCKTYGFSQEQLVGQPFYDFVVRPEDAEDMMKRYTDRFDRGLPIPVGEVEFVKCNGKPVWIQFTGDFVRENDIPKYLVSINVDVSERKQAEEALQASEGKLSAILQKSPIPTAVGGVDGSITSFNEALETLIGYKKSEINDTIDWAKKLYPDRKYREFVEKNIKQALRGEKQDCTEFAITCKNGSRRLIDFHTSFFEFGLVIQMVDITERKQAVEALEEREKYLAIAQKIAHLGNWKLNPLTQEVEGSPELYNIFGLTSNESSLEAFTGVVHPDDLEYDMQHIQRGIEYGESWDIEHRLLLKDGSLKWIHAIGEAIVDEKGKVVLLVGTIQDITERKKAEQALQAERDYSANIIQSVPGLFFVFRKDNGLFRSRNDGWTRATGYSKEELDRMTALDFFEEGPDRDKCAERMRETYDKGWSTMENLLVTKDGRKLPYYFTGQRVVIDGMTYMAGMAIDITDRERAEEALRESEKRFRGLVETMNDGLEMVDENRRFTYLNKRFSEILGRPPEKLINRDASDFLDKSNKKILEEQWLKRKNGDYSPYELEWLRKDGAKVTTIISPKPLIGSNDSFEGSFSVITDITDRKRLEIQDKTKLQLSENLRGTTDINECLKLGCSAIKDTGLFQHIMFLVSGEDRQATNIEYIGMMKKELTAIKKSWPTYFDDVDKDLGHKIKIGNSFIIPDNERSISDIKVGLAGDDVDLSLTDNDKILVPFGGELVDGGGCLLVDTPYQGVSLDRNSITFLEDITRTVAKKVNEIQYLILLKSDKEKLENKNVALREVMANIEEEKLVIKREIADKVDQFVLPLINRLKNTEGSANRTYIELLTKNVQELVYPTSSLVHLYRKLSPREVEICDLIKNGLSSKEIAEMLHLSLATIQKHRERIRNKLGIAHKEVNLTSFLRGQGA
ncbi:MAG: PAS domain S-box protein [candidate division Zixibacteria bacterium]|nr:PAS domain S-box protein [candidate division Zixibacteria bacterium]